MLKPVRIIAAKGRQTIESRKGGGASPDDFRLLASLSDCVEALGWITTRPAFEAVVRVSV
jgi:hypothetical protein